METRRNTILIMIAMIVSLLMFDALFYYSNKNDEKYIRSKCDTIFTIAKNKLHQQYIADSIYWNNYYKTDSLKNVK